MEINIGRQGMIVITDIVKGHLFTRCYMGYTKREAIEAFKQDRKAERKKD